MIKLEEKEKFNLTFFNCKFKFFQSKHRLTHLNVSHEIFVTKQDIVHKNRRNIQLHDFLSLTRNGELVTSSIFF